MAFLESPRFPDSVAVGFEGGPGYNTTVVVTAGGWEQRNRNWSQARHAYDAALAARLEAKAAELKAFFHIAQGRANGFRLKDFTDYRHNDAGGAGVLRMIDSTHFQLVKRYTAGASTADRDIRKPVSTVSVTGGTVSAIDYTTGIVTMTSGTPTAWSGTFDVPCRFDVDELRGNIVGRHPTGQMIMEWGSIPIVEIKV